MMQLEIHTSITDIDRADWTAWLGDDYPFLNWDFLRVLETASCTNAQSGWQPFHMVLRHQDSVIAAAPCFLKDHSYGEYVFDWAWADAWQRAGLAYYPKLVTAAPLTPATGPRIYLNPDCPGALDAFLEAVAQLCRDRGISGWHALFVEETLSVELSERKLHQRMTTQFHWFNRNYQSFDDFLATFSSRKRKNLRKERARVAEQGISLETRVGAAITPEDWRFFHHCYQMTYAKRSGHGGYLTGEFFDSVGPALGDALVMIIAQIENQPVAAALYFRARDTLFGRYWGCLREYDFLHFEACYYQGIEYCIREGIGRFDPGAQGEHKIQRGFEPVLTRSQHWVAEKGFDEALADFCEREREHVQLYREDARTLLPFKADA